MCALISNCRSSCQLKTLLKFSLQVVNFIVQYNGNGLLKTLPAKGAYF